MDKMLGKVRWADGCKHKCCVYPQHKSKTRRIENQNWREEWEDFLVEDSTIFFEENSSDDLGFIPEKLPRETAPVVQKIFGGPDYISQVGEALRGVASHGEILWIDPIDNDRYVR